ncbi:MAG: RAMP superfamily CRISPR-associated protein [Bifidobacteriaceae bacterium]|jgi:CRISPR/Cas system CSM-associated protein Csm3 (group 7 of RAMP superfamily)|nr:RAMP superfamily CRISPR-associated protein [Bifidobacteriaceae bacterium]
MSTKRGFFKVVIHANAGWSVGAEQDPFGGPVGHLVDGGAPRVPVTSLIGSLRDHLRRYTQNAAQKHTLANALGCAHNKVFEVLMGPDSPEKESNTADAEGLSASALWGLSVEVKAASGTDKIATAARGRTAIDRHRGAAAANALWQRTHVAVPTVITLRCRLDADIGALAAVASAIQAWSPRIGGGRSTGSGKASVHEVWYGAIDLAKRTDRERFWAKTGPELVDSIATTKLNPVTLAEPDRERVAEETFSFPEGVRITTGRREEKLDGNPAPLRPGSEYLTKRGSEYLVRGADRYVVPGSTWKGIVRSRFEYVLRTVMARAGDAVWDGNGKAEDSAARIAAQIFGSEDRAGELLFSDSIIEHSTPTARTRVAIDRFTGGARPNALFAETALAGDKVAGGATDDRASHQREDTQAAGARTEGGATAANTDDDAQRDGSEAWTTLVIERAPLKPGDLFALDSSDEVGLAVRKVLAWTLRDLGKGLVPIGSRVTTGLGTLKLSPVEGGPVEPQPEAHDASEAKSAKLTTKEIQALRAWADPPEPVDSVADVPPNNAPEPDLQAGVPPNNAPEPDSQADAEHRDPAASDQSTPVDPGDDKRPWRNTKTGILVSHGQVCWAEAARLGAEMRAVWFGLDGPTHGEIPSDPPVGATHLWAWSADNARLLRMRIEDDRAIVGELRTDKYQSTADPQSPESRGAGPESNREEVQFHCLSPAPIWSTKDGRPSSHHRTQELLGYPTCVFTVLTDTVLEFIALGSRPLRKPEEIR